MIVQIICTVDAENVPRLEEKKMNMAFEEIKDMEEISLVGFDEQDSKKYGYLLIDEDQKRVTALTIF